MAWLAFMANRSEEWAAIAALIPALFLCVVLHELGHALTGRRFGIRTRDITLYPIGGVAMLTDRPKPAHEFWIALAGPAVNVVIAIVLGSVFFAMNDRLPSLMFSVEKFSFLEGLFAANMMLVIFNMIPAFPMDGGRVLRALLGMRMPLARATKIAGTIGQILAILFGFVGLLTGHIFLMVIALFVFLGAQQEVMATVGISLVTGYRVADAMMTRFRVVAHMDTLGAVAKILLEGAQQDFPVVFGEEVQGLLTREDIVRGMAAEGKDAYVAGCMRRDFKRLTPDDPLEQALNSFTQHDRSPVLVMHGDQLVGILTTENLAEFMMLEQARSRT